MSDINLNFDGLIAFLAAAALGLTLLLSILVAASYALVKARQKHEPFGKQRLAPHIIGMFVSLGGCAAVIILLLVGDTKMPPRTVALWLDHWLVVWMLVVLALWPISVVGWKKLRG